MNMIIEKDVIIERLNNLIRENKEAHDMLLTEARKTNGSIIKLKEWKAQATGGFIVANVLIVPVVLWLLYEKLRIGG